MPDNFKPQSPNFMDTLYEAGHITEKGFSTAFTGRFGDSFVDFGKAQVSEMSDIAEYVETPMSKGYFYSAVLQGVKFGKNEDGAEYGLSGLDAIFTTGLSFNMVPSSLNDAFFLRFLENIDAQEDNGVFYTSCGEEMEDVWIMIEEHWIQIRAQDLITDISEAQDNTVCMINFLPSVDDFWVFGTPIFKDYYVYHNPESAILGWAPTVQRFKAPLIKGEKPTTELELPYDTMYLAIKLGAMIGMWAVTILVAVFVFTNSCSGIAFLNQSSRR